MGSELSTLDAADSAAGVNPRYRVAVAAAEGVDVEPLVEACRAVGASKEGPTIDVVVFDPDRDQACTHAAVLVIDPASAVVDDEDVAALRELTSVVGHVALVCGRIESFWDWPRIVREYRSELDPAGALPVFAVSAAAALAVLDEIDNSNLVDHVAAVGKSIATGVEALDHPLISHVRGSGLLLGVVLTAPVSAKVESTARDNGFLINAPAPDVLRLAPPLILTEEQAGDFVAALPQILDAATDESSAQ